MYTILLEKPGYLALKVADSITWDDYQELRPLLDTALHSAKRPRLYWEMEYFRGWKPDELWRDFQFDLTVTADFSAIALVGSTANINQVMPAMEVIFRADIRTFPEGEKGNAWTWFCGNQFERPSK